MEDSPSVLPSFSNWIFARLYFQMTVGGGELVTSHTMMASSPSENSCGDGTFVKVIFSERKIGSSACQSLYFNTIA